MTCREKLKNAHADMSDTMLEAVFESFCPDELGYLKPPDYCDPYTSKCEDCWDREIPVKTNKERPEMSNIDISEVKNESPTIKDSGNRREFESGAVRDMQEGKGRCDLMPLEVVAEYFRLGQYAPDPKRSEDYYWILWNIANFKNSGYTITSYLYSALSVFSARFYDYEPTMFLEVAKHFEEGAKKYSEDNWKKGIPPKCYIDSAVRHFLKCCRGDNDEPHANAFCWNLMCCIWEVDYHMEE